MIEIGFNLYFLLRKWNEHQEESEIKDIFLKLD